MCWNKRGRRYNKREVNWQVNLGLTEREKERVNERGRQIVSKAGQPGHLSAGAGVCLVNPGVEHKDGSGSDRPHCKFRFNFIGILQLF